MKIAKTTFRGSGRLVLKGQRLADDDPAVQGREHLFEHLQVEQATAAPGEKRSLPSKHECDHCGFVAKSAGGLGAHARAHEDA